MVNASWRGGAAGYRAGLDDSNAGRGGGGSVDLTAVLQTDRAVVSLMALLTLAAVAA